MFLTHILTTNALIVIVVTTLASPAPSKSSFEIDWACLANLRIFSITFHRPQRVLVKVWQSGSVRVSPEVIKVKNIKCVLIITCFLKLRHRYRTLKVVRNYSLLTNIIIKNNTSVLIRDFFVWRTRLLFQFDYHIMHMSRWESLLMKDMSYPNYIKY